MNEPIKDLNENRVFSYDNFKRVLIVIWFVFVCLLGCGLILIDNWFTIIIGILFIVVGLFSIIDISFFKSLTFEKDCVIKEWHLFGSKKVNFKNLEVGVSKRLWTGLITFNDTNKGFLSRIGMQFEMFPIGNDNFKEIRNILINKQIIKEDEYEWNF